MICPEKGDLSGVPMIHFIYGENETLYAMAPEFESACKKENVPYTMTVIFAAGISWLFKLNLILYGYVHLIIWNLNATGLKGLKHCSIDLVFNYLALIM